MVDQRRINQLDADACRPTTDGAEIADSAAGENREGVEPLESHGSACRYRQQRPLNIEVRNALDRDAIDIHESKHSTSLAAFNARSTKTVWLTSSNGDRALARAEVW